MARRKIIVEMRYNESLAAAAFSTQPATDGQLDVDVLPAIPGVTFDRSFGPTALPGILEREAGGTAFETDDNMALALDQEGFVDPQLSTYIVRAEMEEDQFDEVVSQESVVGVYSDVQISPTAICPGDPALGTDSDVERLLRVRSMHLIGMNGAGVLVAIVDSGINLDYLSRRGKSITLDAARSWVKDTTLVPGEAPVGHGTMCAYDAAIAAPEATFLDVQLLEPQPTSLTGLLSDAVRAYSHLINIMTAPQRPGEARSLVVNNSWGMFHPSWDFPVGHPGNYSDNPNHPFNRIVGSLERSGADILFAAGNCGADCPDSRCRGVTSNTIYGANGHPAVLTIAGVDTSRARVGYSTQGPGRLARNKPDLCGYTHFSGSGVYPADGGTSAATPVVAGVVAAIRSKRPYNPLNARATPSAIRNLVRTTARDLGTSGFDFDHGYGVVDGYKLYREFKPTTPIDICDRFPRLCVPDICRRFPEICRNIRVPGRPSMPPATLSVDEAQELDQLQDVELGELLDAVWQAGYNDCQEGSSESCAEVENHDGCQCRK